MTSVFENQDPVSTEQELLSLFRERHILGGDRSVEGWIIPHRDLGLHILIAKITGWPEKTEWEKRYLLKKELFESLKKKGYLQQMTPSSWDLSREGVDYFKSMSVKG